MSDWIIPDWPAPASVAALSTTRLGGVSTGPWTSLNLGSNSGDAPEAVARNRDLLQQHLPNPPVWLQQVHGTKVLRHEGITSLLRGEAAREAGGEPGYQSADPGPSGQPPKADAQWSDSTGAVCAVLTADCLPVLFCDRRGTQVAAAHAGWRGLAAGVLENTVAAMPAPASELLAWLGPAIGPAVYQVGDEVRAAFLAANRATGSGSKDQESAEAEAVAAAVAEAFRPDGNRWLFDLYAMARFRLQQAGVGHVSGGGFCTFTDAKRFFSFRRDQVTGRMASLVWLV